MPRFVVKKGGGYMVIASPKLEFLDIVNYVTAGTSLEKLYSSYSVSVPKGTFRQTERHLATSQRGFF